MSIPLAQNFFKESVSTAWTTGAGNFYISTKPTNSIGYLVVSPANSSLREIVKFTAVGTDGGGDYVTLTAANRGLGGTTEQSHSSGEDVYMNVVAEHLQDISDALDQIVSLGAQYANETQIGIMKLSGTPDSTIGTVTVTVATPAVFTSASHGLIVNDIVKITTDGSLPTGLTPGAQYYVIAGGLTANDFRLSSTLDGTAVDTSGSQSGTHTLVNITPVALGPNSALLPASNETDALAGDGGTPSTTNPYRLKSRTKTAGEIINGATLPVPVYQDKTDNELYVCDANVTSKMKYIGFGITDGTDGNDIELQTSGVVNGFTGLLEGEKYYIQDTAGTIGTTIGTYEILAGIAISETELLIQKGKRHAAGEGGPLGTASGSLAVTCGFRPSVIRVNGACGSNSHLSVMMFTWVNGAIQAVNGKHASAGLDGQNPRLYGSGADYMAFTITSVTDTGFTVTWTESGSFPSAGNGYFTWDAEGEL